MTNRKQKRKPEPPPKPEVPKVQHSPGGIKGRWLVNSLSFVLVILAVVVILISVGVSGYYYATVRDNLASRAATTSDTFRKYFTDTYDQFYTQAEATVTTFQDQDKFEQQFLDANGRILLSTSGLSGGGVASTEDASQALSGQKTAVFTGRDPLSGERVMSVTAPLLSARGDLVGGVRYITSLRIVERQIWIIVGCSLLACLLFLMLVVASNSYFIRSIVDPVLKINTIAKEIARQLGFNKLDTGAMYRAVTFAALDRGVDLDDEAAIDALAEQIEIRFTNGTGEDTRLTIDGQDASAAIRTPQVDANVSKVSAYPGVRAAMLIHQRRAAEDRDIVAEGRDIGTVVFPNAQVKVFLTADPRERARRRVLQRHQNDAQPLTSEQLEAEVDETLDALKQRDKLDSSREVAPLVPAEDAVHVDSTAHTIDEVVRIIEGLINQRR